MPKYPALVTWCHAETTGPRLCYDQHILPRKGASRQHLNDNGTERLSSPAQTITLSRSQHLPEHWITTPIKQLSLLSTLLKETCSHVTIFLYCILPFAITAYLPCPPQWETVAGDPGQASCVAARVAAGATAAASCVVSCSSRDSLRNSLCVSLDLFPCIRLLRCLINSCEWILISTPVRDGAWSIPVMPCFDLECLPLFAMVNLKKYVGNIIHLHLVCLFSAHGNRFVFLFLS